MAAAEVDVCPAEEVEQHLCVFGGMLATTWVQIIKAILLMAGTVLLSILVLSRFGFSFAAFFEAVSHVTYHENGVQVTRDFMQPGLRFKPPEMLKKMAAEGKPFYPRSATSSKTKN